jgi:Polyketide cyclase / dehydrase and lipid transport
VRAEGSVLIEAPPARVWEIVTDPRLGGRWNPNVIEVSYFSGMPIQLGTTWKQVVRILGRPTQLTATITQCRAPFSGVVSLTGPGRPRVTITISPEGTGSRLSQIMEVFMPEGIAGVALRLAGPTIQRELDRALQRQKQAVEEAVSV